MWNLKLRAPRYNGVIHPPTSSFKALTKSSGSQPTSLWRIDWLWLGRKKDHADGFATGNSTYTRRKTVILLWYRVRNKDAKQHLWSLEPLEPKTPKTNRSSTCSLTSFHAERWTFLLFHNSIILIFLHNKKQAMIDFSNWFLSGSTEAYL